MRSGDYGVALTGDAVLRSGQWRELSRTTADWALGLAATAKL